MLYIVSVETEELPTSFPGFSPTRATEQERERETLENAGHVAPEQNYF